MKILALDTAMAACSAAVVNTDGVTHPVASQFKPMERGHAEAIAPMVQEVMASAGMQFSDLDRLAVTTGPGTFTGVRIGLSMARGLGLATGLPVIGIDTLRAIAANDPTPGTAVLVAADARRDEVYAALYDAQRRVLRQPAVMAVAAAGHELPPGTRIIGTAAEMVITACGRPDLICSSSGNLPVATQFAALAALLPLPQGMPSPLYLRAPDAKSQAATSPQPAGPALKAVSQEAADLLAALHAACFDSPWEAKAFSDLLAMPGAAATIATERGRPVGFLLTRRAADEAEVITIGTSPAARRRGIGRTMLNQQLTEFSGSGVHHVFMEVARSNAAALALYASLGFTEAGKRNGYYRKSDGSREDAIIMRKDLTA